MRTAMLAPVTVVLLAAAGCSGSHGDSGDAPLELSSKQGANLTITAADLAKAAPGGAVVGFEKPAHGTVEYVSGGGVIYKPDATFSGTEEIKVRVSDAVQRFPAAGAPLGTVGGIQIQADGVGTALTPVPGSPNEFYGITARGPMAYGPGKLDRVLALPGYTPEIGRFRLADGAAQQIASIPLQGRDSKPMTGVPSTAAVPERYLDLDGKVLPVSNVGIAPTGMVVLGDGSFWVVDDYGPNLVHFDRNGQELDRVTTGRGGLAEEISSRDPGQQVHGLALTPDGKTLIFAVHSVPDRGTDATSPVVRLIAYQPSTRTLRQYAYLLDDPRTDGRTISAITALSPTELLVVERTDRTPPGASQKVYRVDLGGATDVPVGSAPESIAGTGTAQQARAALHGAGITTVRKTPAIDVGALLDQLNPQGFFFGQDRIDALASTDGGKTVYLSGDNDFGVAGLASTQPPFGLKPKLMPNGLQATGEVLRIDTTRLPARVRDSVIRIKVG
jgi:hypothetical protein